MGDYNGGRVGPMADKRVHFSTVLTELESLSFRYIWVQVVLHLPRPLAQTTSPYDHAACTAVTAPRVLFRRMQY